MRTLLIIIFFLYGIKANAQNYLISFAGSGASPTVGSVKVENLRSGNSLTLNGTDILRLTIVTGVNSVENKKSSELKIYPNPMNGNSVLQIYPPAEGNADIKVFDMTGREVAQMRSYLENSLQEFRLSGLPSGFYMISVKGDSYSLSAKLISNGKPFGQVNIGKISSNLATEEKVSKNAVNKGVQDYTDMPYSVGDRIKFTGISGNYSTIKTDIPTGDKTITFNFISCTDGDNNNYPVVAIGDRVWMAENLKTTKYRNGVLIGTTTPATLDISGESTPKYQWAYDGNESNVPAYGRLYTWYTVTDSRNVCPSGWHVPTDDEWTNLTDYLINNGYAYGGFGSDIGKSMAASSNWITFSEAGTIGNDQAGNNSSGFSALPGGNRSNSSTFLFIGYYGFWWCFSEYNSTFALYRYMYSNYRGVYRSSSSKQSGYSVRCLKD